MRSKRRNRDLTYIVLRNTHRLRRTCLERRNARISAVISRYRRMIIKSLLRRAGMPSCAVSLSRGERIPRHLRRVFPPRLVRAARKSPLDPPLSSLTSLCFRFDPWQARLRTLDRPFIWRIERSTRCSHTRRSFLHFARRHGYEEDIVGQFSEETTAGGGGGRTARALSAGKNGAIFGRPGRWPKIRIIRDREPRLIFMEEFTHDRHRKWRTT